MQLESRHPRYHTPIVTSIIREFANARELRPTGRAGKFGRSASLAMKAKAARTKLLDLTGTVERRVLPGIVCDISASQTWVSDNSTAPLGAVKATACRSGAATLAERAPAFQLRKHFANRP